MSLIDPKIASIAVGRRHREICQALRDERLAREQGGTDRAEVHRSPAPWRLSVARLLYRAADTVAGHHPCEEINACR
ncbi:MAG TPA: hypothetical protein VNJ51_04035 [Candidatus Dormibacteraeota bacterium]|nr:hypothetical protein [Candidatus Dormibacteraeota bacterium]